MLRYARLSRLSGRLRRARTRDDCHERTALPRIPRYWSGAALASLILFPAGFYFPAYRGAGDIFAR